MELPVKEKFIVRRTRWFYYFVVEANNTVQVRKRDKGDIWENLYEFILLESQQPLDDAQLNERSAALVGSMDFEVSDVSAGYTQLLTHQTIKGQFIRIQTSVAPKLQDYLSVSADTLQTLPFPKFISNYLKDKNVSLNLFNTKRNQQSNDLIPTT